MRRARLTRTAVGAAVAITTVITAAVTLLGPISAASADTLYQPTNITFSVNPGFTAQNCSQYWAFPSMGGYTDYDGTSDVGNAQGQLRANFDFPVPISTADIQITAPQGPTPADLPAGAPWGTIFPSETTTNATTESLWNDYNCTQQPSNNFYIVNYLVTGKLATEPNAPSTCGTHGDSACTCPDAGGTGSEVSGVSVNSAGNVATITTDFTVFGEYCVASNMEVDIADVVNPVEGSYTGLQYSVLVEDPGVYSAVPAPSTSTLTYTAGSPDPDTSQLSETVPSNSTGQTNAISATANPASGATVTATIYDSCYNPISNLPIYIGAAPGSPGGETEPTSNSSSSVPTTNDQGQAQYYAWSTTATTANNPDLFFGEIYYASNSANNQYIDQTVAPPSPSTTEGSSCDQDAEPSESLQTVSLYVTAADPSPASGSGAYSSEVEANDPEQTVSDVPPCTVDVQSTSVTVDSTATVCLHLVDQWDNPEVQNSIVLTPIQSANQPTNDFKDVSVTADYPSGSWDGTDGHDFDCASGPASVIPGASCTTDEGWTVFSVQDTKDQSVSFEITDETDGYTFPYTDSGDTDEGNIPVTTFTVGPTSATTSAVNVDGGQSANVLADDSAEATVTVTLLDDHGNPESGKEVELLTEGGPTGTITPTDPWTTGSVEGTTNANGVAVFNIVNGTLGTTEYEAYDVSDGLFLSNTNQLVSVNWVTGAVSASNSSVAAAPSTVVGDGQGVSTVTVTVNDVGDHPLAGETVALDTSSFPDLTVVPPAATTNFAGVATFEVRSTSPESVDIPVLVGATSPVTLSNDADIDFTLPVTTTSTGWSLAGGTCLVDSVLWSNTHDGSPVADGCDSADVTASLANGTTPISGLTVELITGTALSGPTLTTNGSGDVSFPVSLSPTSSDLTQTYSLLDVSDNDRLVGTVTITFVPIPDEAHQSTVLPPSQAVYTYDPSQPADTQTAVVTVHLASPTGEAIQGDTVSLAQIGGSSVATITPVSSDVSDASGDVAFDVTDPDVDSVVLQATDTSTSVTLAETAIVNFVLRPNEAEISTVAVNPDAVEANGASTSTITVTLENNGVFLAGDTVSLSQGHGHAVITTADPVSNAAGQVTFKVSDFTPESIAFEATDLTTGTLLDHDGVVTFTTPPGGPLQPSVTSVAPDSGPGSGGTVVTVTGTNLVDVTKVDFGTVPATTFSTTVAGTTLVAVSPIPVAAGAVDVTVTNPVGTSATNSGDVFTYTSAAPLTVTDVYPNAGPITGGTTVTLSGTDFANVRSVDFGTKSATFHTNANGTITAVAPSATSAATVAVTVATSGATSFDSAQAGFTYQRPEVVTPSVHALSSRSGPLAGGNVITITGAGFTTGARVRFGATLARVVRVTSTVLRVVVPRGARAGKVTVTVTTTDGTSRAVAAATYTYSAPRPRATRT